MKTKSLVIKGRHFNKAEIADYRKYIDEMWDRIVEAGLEDTGTAIDPILPQSEWKDTAKRYIAHMLGGDSDVTTPSDIANYADTESDWLVEGGLGSLIKNLHVDVPVALSCPVTKIDYSGQKIRVTTPRGVIETDHVVLTVSVGVMAAETIEFIPALPDWKLKAINELPNGLLNKVGIEFDPEWKEVSEAFVLDYHAGDGECCSIVFRFYDSELATGFTGGRFAKLLETEGPGSMTEFCMQALKETFGADVLKYVRKTAETAWHGNPNTFGSYSYALPGCVSARSVLAETLNERIFFAGEATMPNVFATVHGAFMSGKEAADRLLKQTRER